MPDSSLLSTPLSNPPAESWARWTGLAFGALLAWRIAATDTLGVALVAIAVTAFSSAMWCLFTAIAPAPRVSR